MFTSHLRVGNIDQEILVFSSQNLLLLTATFGFTQFRLGKQENCPTDFETLLDGKVYRCESSMKLAKLGSF